MSMPLSNLLRNAMLKKSQDVAVFSNVFGFSLRGVISLTNGMLPADERNGSLESEVPAVVPPADDAPLAGEPKGVPCLLLQRVQKGSIAFALH